MKKIFKIIFFSSLVLVLLFSALLIACTVSVGNNGSSSVGIIGGADGPTAILITRTLILGNPIFFFLCLVFIVLLTSAIGWILTKKK